MKRVPARQAAQPPVPVERLQAQLWLSQSSASTLMNEGVKAKLALEAGACTEAVEKIIEANTLLSGIGFESAGLCRCSRNP